MNNITDETNNITDDITVSFNSTLVNTTNKFLINNQSIYEQVDLYINTKPNKFFQVNDYYNLTGSRDASLYYHLKRITDIVLSIMVAIVFLPIGFISAILIKLEDKGPIFFSQTRIGKNGKPFTMYKFRSMCLGAESKLISLSALNERDGPVFKIKNDPRVTKIGRFIRRTCLDELPQLINIIKGDMSIVGPRPPIIYEVEKYTPYQAHRLDIKPGLTCYWQISNKDLVTFDQWIDMDIKYIKECSLLIDLQMILKTVIFIFKRRGDT